MQIRYETAKSSHLTLNAEQNEINKKRKKLSRNKCTAELKKELSERASVSASVYKPGSLKWNAF